MSPHTATITLCAAAAAGVFLIALADRLRLPSIALLLVGGIALGPKVAGLLDPRALGAGLETVVSLAVAVILFEGGLTLDVAGFRREPKVIVRMLTLGVLVTWTGTAAAVYAVYPELGLELAMIAGSLVIVTGPTVVSPLLRRIGVRPRLHHILYWEGVLVDAVGVFIAVLCYEWIASAGDAPTLAPLGRFALRFAVGAGIGVAAGLALGQILRRRWVGPQHANIVTLGGALLAVGAANAVLAESGILAAIIAGLVLSLQRAPELERLKRFELELTEVGVGLLFVLLAAKLELSAFVDDGGRLIAVLALVLLALRPLNVLIATWGQNFDWREKAFLSWLAPRGIVAASMASLFALRLDHLGHAGAQFLETLTYAVIGTTVLVQGLSAPALARALGLQRRSRGSWLIIGDPGLGVALHRQLRQAGARSLVMAVEPEHDLALADEGVRALAGQPLEPESIRDPRLADVEAVLAVARDPHLNHRICEAWAPIVGAQACYRWGDGDDDAAGVPVWLDAPTANEAATAVAADSFAIEALEVGDAEDAARFGPELRPLLGVSAAGIEIVHASDLPPEASRVVALRRRVPGLYGLVRDALIVHKPEAAFQEVVSALLGLAAQATPGLDTERHLAEILDREQTMPTTVGNGVALPHVYDPRVERSSCFVGSVTSGLDVLGPDAVPVRLVFLVVSPTGQAQEHLRSLAAIAQLASESSLLEVLLRQRTRGRLLSLLRERE